MLRRGLIPFLLFILLAACGGQPDEAASSPPAPSFFGDWKYAHPVERSVSLNFTFRLREGGQARLLVQNGPSRPFVDRRGRWVEEDGVHYAELKNEAGEFERFVFEPRDRKMLLRYEFRELPEIMFLRRD